MHVNEWKKVWNKSEAPRKIQITDDRNAEDIFTELKLYTNPNYHGGEHQDGVYEKFTNQFDIYLKQLSFSVKENFHPTSFFDVGCATGSYLYYLSKIKKMSKLGGIDYSSSFIEVAKQYVSNPVELYCSEAASLRTEIKYDCVYSRSIFQYFDNIEYGKTVVRKMIEKANHSVGILDVHDLMKRELFLKYRRSVIEDYDEKYKCTQHCFYPKSMFIDIAEEYDCEVKFAHCYIPGYWNAPYTYDVYLYKH